MHRLCYLVKVPLVFIYYFIQIPRCFIIFFLVIFIIRLSWTVRLQDLSLISVFVKYFLVYGVVVSHFTLCWDKLFSLVAVTELILVASFVKSVYVIDFYNFMYPMSFTTVIIYEIIKIFKYFSSSCNAEGYKF